MNGSPIGKLNYDVYSEIELNVDLCLVCLVIFYLHPCPLSLRITTFLDLIDIYLYFYIFLPPLCSRFFMALIFFQNVISDLFISPPPPHITNFTSHHDFFFEYVQFFLYIFHTLQFFLSYNKFITLCSFLCAPTKLLISEQHNGQAEWTLASSLISPNFSRYHLVFIS